MTVEERGRLPQVFENLWADIRSSRVYAGQPRNADSNRGVRLANQALTLASEVQEPSLMLEARRMMAYSLTADEQYADAIPHYESAIHALEAAGNRTLAARIRIGYVYALTHVGRYEEALQAAGVSERWFRESRDDAGFARLCNNVASLHQRLDRYEQSYEYFLAASKIFEAAGDRQAVAQVCLNMGYTLARIDRFEETEEMYARAERLADELGMQELSAQASYNHAYFYFLVGRYSDALRSFAQLRGRFRDHGSQRHLALCDLDEAEIYLQLNLPNDASSLAQSAVCHFREIGMRYEEAKARAFHGVALMQMGRLAESVETFRVSQEGFDREGNHYWVAVLDLYRAEVYLELQRYWEAQALALKARERFQSLAIPSRQMLSLVILGKIALAVGNTANAEKFADEIDALTDRGASLLRFPYHLLRGQIAERKGIRADAVAAYGKAADDLELHQSRLRHDDLRVAYLQGRHQVYESLVRLTLDAADDPVEASYSWCGRAKSRGLVELLSHHLPSMQPKGNQSLLRRVHRLREELNFRYIESRPEAGGSQTANSEETLSKEQELARLLREAAVRDPEAVSLQRVTAPGLEAVQQFVPERSTVIEYFCSQEEVIAYVVSRDSAKVFRRLAPPSRIQLLQERLAFQLEKFLLGPGYVREHAAKILDATNHYLKSLHDVLLAPLLSEVRTPHITVIPHGLLHFVPFHALWDGEGYLIDRCEVSYAPSASVLRYCMEKPEVEGSNPLILGVADELAPLVEVEAHALAVAFPQSRVLTGGEATRRAFAEAAPASSFIHVATHAAFRQDNPMFSNFKLADGYVTALDLFSMDCNTNLVTLSGCKSGLGAVSGSDDLLGLMRGFLYAGARSLMLSLWNINDESTLFLMQEFYREWQSGSGKAKALQSAMKTVRERYPNPFYWAPFVLVGKM